MRGFIRFRRGIGVVVMPGKQARALCPVCQEPMPPDETECRNCGAFVIDEAVVRLSRAFGLPREKALQLFEKGFRHPKQLKDGDVDGVLKRGDVGLLYICTNCGSFVATGESKCSRCGAEFEEEAPSEDVEERDILDLVLCPVCGADNDPSWRECEICGETLNESGVMPPEPAAQPRIDEAPSAAPIPDEALGSAEKKEETAEPSQQVAGAEPGPILEEVDERLEDVETSQKTVTRVSRLPKIARPAPKPLPPSMPVRPGKTKPGTRPTDSSKIGPKPVPRQIPKVPAPVEQPRLSGIPASPSPSAKKPTARKASAQSPPSGGKPARRSTQPRTPQRASRVPSARGVPPDDFVGAITVASGVALVLGSFLGFATIAWGAAVLFGAVVAYSVGSWSLSVHGRMAPVNLLLLGAGAALGSSAVMVPLSVAPIITIGATVPLALAATRLLPLSSRGLLTGASATILVALALSLAFGTAYAGTVGWVVGVGTSLLWAAAVVYYGVRARNAAIALRRELVEAERHVQREDYTRSLQDYDRAIRVGAKGVPGEDLPWYGKGATLILLGRYEEALRAIDTALDINPRNEVAWVNKGNALTRMGRLMDALRCFNAALKVNPTYEVAWNNRGNTLARLGKNEEALRCYDKALEIDSEYRGAWVNKGYVLTKLGRYDEASACADRALRASRRRRPDPA